MIPPQGTDSLIRDELVRIARHLGVDATGSRTELARRLLGLLDDPEFERRLVRVIRATLTNRL